MSSITESESLFENFCQMHQVRWRRIEVSTMRMPDYNIFVKRRKIIVEVKQINPNPEEEKKITEFRESGRVTIKSDLGKRVRGKIIDAQGKFRRSMGNRYPSILVLYNNVELYKHTDPMDILAGMYGKLHFTVAPNMPIRDMELGPNRTMTDITHTSISAIGVLQKGKKGNPALTLYHNVYAKVPLNPDLLSGLDIKQYSNSGCTWKAIIN